MNKLKQFFRRALATYRSINMVDRYLIIIMTILWVHGCLVLLSPREYFGEMQNVDVMVRTSISSVFGYFLSSNFLQPKIPPPPSAADSKPALPAAIPPPAQPPQPPPNNPKQSRYPWEKDLQVRVIAYIGIFSLLLLIVRRQVNLMVPNPQETVSANAQSMRDLIAGSIGFLIGYVSDTSKS